jgi:AraC-like DNA-binding protein
MDIEEGELEWLFITFELGSSQGIEDLRDRPRILDPATLSRIEKMLRLRTSNEKNMPDRNLEIAYELSEVLRTMLSLPLVPESRMNINGSDNVRDVLLEKINSIVRKNLDKQITIADLASEMNYSVSYLRAIFRENLGISLGKYIRESRLSRAAQLLLEAELSVTEIAAKTGFESLFAFSRAFKKAYGVSPKAYSKLVIKGL